LRFFCIGNCRFDLAHQDSGATGRLKAEGFNTRVHQANKCLQFGVLKVE